MKTKQCHRCKYWEHWVTKQTRTINTEQQCFPLSEVSSSLCRTAGPHQPGRKSTWQENKEACTQMATSAKEGLPPTEMPSTTAKEWSQTFSLYSLRRNKHKKGSGETDKETNSLTSKNHIYQQFTWHSESKFCLRGFFTSSQQGPLIFLFIKNSSKLDVLVPNTWEKVSPFKSWGSCGISAWKRQRKKKKLLFKTITSHFLKSTFEINKSLTMNHPLIHMWQVICHKWNPKQLTVGNKINSQWQNKSIPMTSTRRKTGQEARLKEDFCPELYMPSQ